jgi:hypothetical protein
MNTQRLSASNLGLILPITLLIATGCSSVDNANDSSSEASSASIKQEIITSPEEVAEQIQAAKIADGEIPGTRTTSVAGDNSKRGPASQLQCPGYTVFYIDPSTQFFTPPVPLEDHAEFVFCSSHPNLDEIRVKLKKMKPVRSQADLDGARIKVIPRGNDQEALTFCSSGEITYRGKQYRLDRRAFEPSLLALTEEGDRQRSMAIEKENEEADQEPRGPASKKKSP